MYSNWKTHTHKVKKTTLFIMIKHSTLFKLQNNTQTAKNEFYVFGSCFRMLAVVLVWEFFGFVFLKNHHNKLI